MKFLFALLLVLLVWMGSTSRTTGPDTTDVVSHSLRTGSARQLAAHFNPNIELIIDSEAIEFPSVEATHAEFILKSFFRKYPPQGFQYVYQGRGKHQHYSMGTYQTGRERFQVYILMHETTSPLPASDPTPQHLISRLHFRKVS